MYCKRCGKGFVKNSEYCTDCAGLQCKICGQMPAKNSEYCTNCLIHKTRFANMEIVGLILGAFSMITWMWPIIGYSVSLIGFIFSYSGKMNNRRFASLASSMNFIGLMANTVHVLVRAWLVGRFGA